MSEECFKKLLEEYEKKFRGHRGKLPVVLFTKDEKLGPLHQHIAIKFPKYGFDSLDIVTACRDAEREGIAQLSCDEGSIWLINIDAFKDLETLKEHCKDGLAQLDVYDDCLTEWFEENMKEEYRKAFYNHMQEIEWGLDLDGGPPIEDELWESNIFRTSD